MAPPAAGAPAVSTRGAPPRNKASASTFSGPSAELLAIRSRANSEPGRAGLLAGIKMGGTLKKVDMQQVAAERAQKSGKDPRSSMLAGIKQGPKLRKTQQPIKKSSDADEGRKPSFLGELGGVVLRKTKTKMACPRDSSDEEWDD